MREPDGLALSSRNVYLSDEERKAAPALYRSLLEGAEVVRESGAATEAEKAVAEIASASGFDLDYGRVVDPETFEPWTEGTALIVVAGRFGSTRLIDNLLVDER